MLQRVFGASRFSNKRESVVGGLCLLLLLLISNPCHAQEELAGLKVPDGFVVEQFASDKLAHNIYNMTFDSLGRVVVSGPGYVKILIDSDGDGQADRAQLFADGPRTGAQGMYFDGHDLYCIGDAGLIRYRDADADDTADGPADVLLKMKTGGEHDAHAIRKGPDGCWYILAGNLAGIDKKYISSPTSPVKNPQAGVLLRITPDLKKVEVIAHGFRNPYDFDFNAQGDIFTYDSDGERDVSLPWYRPTRVFQVTPGSHAGWVCRSWKRPDYYYDMPSVVASFGRGSPTGVVTYRHVQFPKAYHNAVFVLDWTFGRVLAVPLVRNGAGWKSKPITFMTGIGDFGFAPTDAAVGPDGRLYVAVGGRGTRGGVYRVSYPGPGVAAARKRATPPEPAAVDEEKLEYCLNAPQPLSSWSRARWEPLAMELAADQFINALAAQKLTNIERVNCQRIIKDHFELKPEIAFDFMKPLRNLYHADAAVRHSAIQFLNNLSAHDLNAKFNIIRSEIIKRNTGSTHTEQALAERTLELRWAELGYWAAHSHHDRQSEAGELDYDRLSAFASKILQSKELPNDLKLDTVRVLQVALGDMGPKAGRAAVFDGYGSQIDLDPLGGKLDSLRVLLDQIYPTNDKPLDWEVARLSAMLQPGNPKILEKVLAKISTETHPVDDIHHLIVAARIPVRRTTVQTAHIADALLSLDIKIKQRQLNQDRNWDDRVGEMYQALVDHDPELPAAIVRNPQFGRAGHVLFMSQIAQADIPVAIAAFVRLLESDDAEWTSELVFLISKSDESEHRERIRSQYDNLAVQSAVVMVLAEQPQEIDRDKFIRGLSSPMVEVITASLKALQDLSEKYSEKYSVAEQVALYKLLRRLSNEKQDYAIRERVIRLLQSATGHSYGFVFGTEGYAPQPDILAKWSEYFHQAYPKLIVDAGSADQMRSIQERLARIDWNVGDQKRGEQLFVARSCSRCHGGGRALGPDLKGVSKRFSRHDLFAAILLPNRDVSPRYKTTLILTKSGKVYTGLVVYQSVDGITLRNGLNQTIRIESDQIEEQRTTTNSLMPADLLKNLNDQHIADLYAYLKAL